MTSTHPDNPEAAHYFKVTRHLEEKNKVLKDMVDKFNAPLTPEEFAELRKLDFEGFTKYLRKRAGLDET